MSAEERPLAQTWESCFQGQVPIEHSGTMLHQDSDNPDERRKPGREEGEPEGMWCVSL